MVEHTLFYAFFSFLTALTSSLVAILLWQRRHAPGGLPLFGFMLALFVWSGSYGIFWLSTSPENQVFWLNCTYFGVVATPITFIIFTLEYTNRQHWLNRYVIGVLFVELVVTLILVWTDPQHQLFFGGKRLPSTSKIFDGGIWFWFHIVFSYTSIALVIVLLIRTYWRSQKIYRQQIPMMIFAVTLPWVSNLLSLLNLNPLPQLDLTPIAFTATGILITYAVFYKRLFDYVPIARDTVMETIHEPVFVLDNFNRIVDLNPSARCLLNEIGGQNYGSVIGESFKTCFPSLMDWTPIEGATNELELRVGEQTRYYEHSVSCLMDQRQRQQGRVFIFNDVTRRKEMQARELEIRLQRERTRMLSEFIRTVSHEFRTPLAIINSTAYLTARLPEADKRIEKAKFIEHSVQRIAKLIDMMLMMTALATSSGQFLLIDVGAALQTVARDFPPDPNQPTIKWLIPGMLPKIKGESQYLEAAVKQIIDNACRYTPPDGQVEVIAYATHEQVIIEVKDTGMGISPSDLPNIFNTFWRYDHAHSTPGLGVGLSIVERSIRLHKGTIDVQSEVGKGSVFRICLPLAA
ncbi:MAG: hypothetical protein IT321_08690 [Anaerolineae bacterium]|nr:hypothetical protein [Anaerolineae bacterium]